MLESDKLFDLGWGAFVDEVFLRGGARDWPAERDLTPGMVRGVLISLAYTLWGLGQRVKKLEEEE